MGWFCTMLLSGMLLAIGWRFGTDVYRWIRSFVTEAPDGIRRIRSYRNRRNNRGKHVSYYYMKGKRS